VVTEFAPGVVFVKVPCVPPQDVGIGEQLIEERRSIVVFHCGEG